MTQIAHVGRFWDELANNGNYRDALVGWYAEHMADESEKDNLFRGMDPNKEALALEFGCGPGRNMIKFRDMFKRIDGVDISAVILEKLVDDVTAAGLKVPNRYHINGYTLDGVPDSVYDVVFAVISMQHVGSRKWRLSLLDEFRRVLKPNGILTFQMGYGPGNPHSRDYFHEYTEEDEAAGKHFDTRVENMDHLRADLIDHGFHKIDFRITDPVHDQHPKWIWTYCERA